MGNGTFLLRAQAEEDGYVEVSALVSGIMWVSCGSTCRRTKIVGGLGPYNYDPSLIALEVSIPVDRSSVQSLTIEMDQPLFGSLVFDSIWRFAFSSFSFAFPAA